MKVIYHPSTAPRWQEYGIQVPILDNRSQKVFNYLLSDCLGIDLKNDEECSNYYTSLPKNLSLDQLRLIHDSLYLKKLFDPEKCLEEINQCFELELCLPTLSMTKRFDPSKAIRPLSDLSIDILRQATMTFVAMEEAIECGSTYFLGGGMHHGHSFKGRGFCLLNDIMIGLINLIELKKIKTAWVIDVDAHLGDGTAEIARLFSNVGTLSIHMGEGWPLSDDTWTIYPSDVDIAISRGDEESYLCQLQKGIEKLEKLYPWPDFIVINHGADTYEHDKLESAREIKLSLDQLRARDEFLIEFLKEKKVPHCYLMSGGYGERSWEVYAQFFELFKLHGGEISFLAENKP